MFHISLHAAVLIAISDVIFLYLTLSPINFKMVGQTMYSYFTKGLTSGRTEELERVGSSSLPHTSLTLPPCDVMAINTLCGLKCSRAV